MFSYLGGKKFQAKWIASQFPKHNTYVEPFGGAYWVYFMANHQIDQAHTNVYNDFNKDIANIFHCARYDDRKFLKSLFSISLEASLIIMLTLELFKDPLFIFFK